MAIDLYALCPCGSGKKLKFCCSDLVAEIQKVEKLVAGEQPHAALRFVQQLLEKQPQRASLLDLQASLELSLEEFDAARDTVRQYLALHPDNPSAYGQAAVLAAAKGETAAAVGALQAALERLEKDMPQRVFEAIGAVGHALLVAGDYVAARAHLVLYAGLAPQDDNRGVELLLRMNLQGNPPLFLRDQLLLAEAPAESVAWKADFEEANRLAMKGLWQRAEADYVHLLDSSENAPEVVYNLALVRGWLGDTPQLANGLRTFAQLDIPWDDAIEAEALAQLIDPNEDEPSFESEQRTYAVNDADQLAERFLADKRVESIQIDPETEDSELGHPRDSFVLLDRPALTTGVDLPIGDVPNLIAFASLYGKRTDREAQLIVTADRGPELEKVEKTLLEIGGDALGQCAETEVVGQKSLAEDALSWRWRLPDDTPPDQRRRLLSQRRRQAVLQDWPSAQLGVLGGKTPEEAAGNESLRLPLAAAALIVEQAASDPAEAELFQQLRKQLQLPLGEPINPTEVDLERLPLIRVARLKLSELTTPQLEALLTRTVMSGAQVATLCVSRELVSRDVADEQEVNLGRAYRQLIRLESDSNEATRWVREAKQWAEKTGANQAEWAVMDLELQLERGDVDDIQRALGELKQEYLSDPKIAEAVYRLLYAAGLGSLMQPSEERASPVDAATPDAPSSEIWTPEGAAKAEQGDAKSAIWTP